MDYVSRKDWGAKYAEGFGERNLPTSETWLHHSVTLSPDLEFKDLNKDSRDDDEVQAMQTIEQIGQQRFGAGFSYNIAVMPSGRPYIGCGVRRIGSHTAKRNTKALGIVLVGNYETTKLPEQMKTTLVDILRDSYRLGWATKPAFTGGHRDLKETACPGKYAYLLIPSFNSAAAKKKIVTPTPIVEIEEPSMYALVREEKTDPVYAVREGVWVHITPQQLQVLRKTGLLLNSGKIMDLTTDEVNNLYNLLTQRK